MLEAAKRIQHVTGKMATLIQANSRPYPGQTAILDLRGSLARGERRPAPTASGIYRAVRQVLGPLPPDTSAPSGPSPVEPPAGETKPPKPEAGAA